MKIGLKLRLRACPARGNLAWDKKYYLLVDLKIKHVLLVIVLLYTNAVIHNPETIPMKFEMESESCLSLNLAG